MIWKNEVNKYNGKHCGTTKHTKSIWKNNKYLFSRLKKTKLKYLIISLIESGEEILEISVQRSFNDLGVKTDLVEIFMMIKFQGRPPKEYK